MASRDVFGERYRRRREKLSPSFQRVAAFIDANRMLVITSSAVVIAREIGTSDATVVRAVQALGFEGLHDLRSELASAYGVRDAPLDNLARTLADTSDDVNAAFDAVAETMRVAMESLGTPAFRQNALDAVGVLNAAGRIVVFGLGPTAHLAAYFAARLRRKGRRQAVLDRTGIGLADQLLDLAPGDVLLMMAFGRPYPEASAAAAEATRLRIPLILVTDIAASELAARAKAVLVVPRGQSERIALNGATIFCLEMLLVGLASADPDKAVSSLTELERLREATRTARKPVRRKE